MDVCDVAIIGSGPAGFTAAIYAARADLHPILFEGEQPGGQLTTTTEVENFPGFPQGIFGTDLMGLMKEQAARFGTDVRAEQVQSLLPGEKGFVLTVRGTPLVSRTVILAMGATARRLGLASERVLYGKGVSACATCDGAFFRGKEVMVVGGGDSAMEEANFLTRFASLVTIVHRRDAFRASKIMQARTLAHPKIHVRWNSEIVEILGADVGYVTGVRIRDTVTGEIHEQKTDGVFAAIGHEPNTALVRGWIELNEGGYIKTQPGTTRTSAEGVFACGDIQDPHYRQAITAAGSGCMAALEAERHLRL